jgi:hypothetical protein
MKHRSTFGFFVVLTVLIIAGGVGLASRWQQTMLLRGELDGLRDQERELKALRAANEGLRGQQVSAAELAALRADHAAVGRLRAELEALKKVTPAAR